MITTESPSTRKNNNDKHLQNHTSLSDVTLASGVSTTIADSISMLKQIMKYHEQDPFLLLDIKSRHVPERIWALVVGALRDAGIRVQGLGSFVIPKILNTVVSHCIDIYSFVLPL